LTIVDAAMEAARLRLRPILMTAFAFILGVVPLMIASGQARPAGNRSERQFSAACSPRRFLTLLFVPVIYAVIEGLRERGHHTKIECIQAASDRGRVENQEIP